jgi:hypothetical protein
VLLRPEVIYHFLPPQSVHLPCKAGYLNPYFSGHTCHVNSLISASSRSLIDGRLDLDSQNTVQVHKTTMSGAEAVAILGGISSIISINDGAKQVYNAATSAEGLPGAFREVAGRLPIITHILGAVEQCIKDGNITEDSCKRVKQVIDACQEKAKKLEDLFCKVIPGENTSRRERYLSAVKTLGKGNKVERLIKGILEDVYLLVSEHNMRVASSTQLEQVATAISEVSSILPSVPENRLQEPSFITKYSGSGTQNNAQGEYVAQGDARQYISGGGSMHFGKD